jgi:hypothetical protein
MFFFNRQDYGNSMIKNKTTGRTKKGKHAMPIPQLPTSCTELEHHLPKNRWRYCEFWNKDDMDRRDKMVKLW